MIIQGIHIRLILLVVLGMCHGATTTIGQAQTERRLFDELSKQVVIRGGTNVNRFECALQVLDPQYELDVSIMSEADELHFEGLEILVPVDSFDCRRRMMNNEFRELLKSDLYPNLTINIRKFISPRVTRDSGQDFKFIAVADVTVGEVTREEIFEDCYISIDGNLHTLGGSHLIRLTDYRIAPPSKFLGTVVVRNELDITFEAKLDEQHE